MKMNVLIFTFFMTIFKIGHAADQDFQQWLNLSSQGLISEKYSLGLYTELQTRRSDDQNKFFETLLRPAVYYKTENHGSFFLGFLKRFDSNSNEVETRYWIQWLKNFNHNDLNMTLRLRLEERDLNVTADHQQRLRLSGRVLHQSLFEMTAKPFISTEFFYNLNSVNQDLPSGLNQNRTAVGFCYKYSPEITFDISYMLVTIKNTTKPDQLNNVLNIGIGHSF